MVLVYLIKIYISMRVPPFLLVLLEFPYYLAGIRSIIFAECPNFMNRDRI